MNQVIWYFDGRTTEKTWIETTKTKASPPVLPICLPPPQREHVIAIEELFQSGCLWKSMWAIMEHERAEEGGGGQERRGSPRAIGGPAKQLNGCKQHQDPHVQTFKISAGVMGSAWPLSGCAEPSLLPSNTLYWKGGLCSSSWRLSLWVLKEIHFCSFSLRRSNFPVWPRLNWMVASANLCFYTPSL